ncbi:MAG: 50S ribosomal protein L5 [Ignavibacteriales bacterium]|nr:50S ribosomal protein L5 [Ignavibacteriales bacterium]MCF8315692.1 50S ribosomal protein L5 [Ignavibacteriales bacterium]MCF8437114.1 50S ribosomal protein L5 [Ignavibacteriales bacterium]
MAKSEKKTQDTKQQPKAAPKEKAVKAAVAEEKIPARLYEKYKSEIIQKLRKDFSYKNVMEVPKLQKIVVNMGLGDAVQDQKVLEEAVKELETITGQKPSVRAAKKSISNFKLREGMKIGAKVTLRREIMFEFLDRLITVVLPRVRDFKGISDKSFDGKGNYTLGVKEHIIFPEINVDKVPRVLGMDITFVTNAKSDNEAHALLTAFGLPFRKKEIQ